ncbi:MAG: hypothetical protein SFT81_02085 [Candidatus Caenarcaniphilales bacterium]|nr:hypothetical protein [Candidatus Caenarcaniphilales bacterium]
MTGEFSNKQLFAQQPRQQGVYTPPPAGTFFFSNVPTVNSSPVTPADQVLLSTSNLYKERLDLLRPIIGDEGIQILLKKAEENAANPYRHPVSKFRGQNPTTEALLNHYLDQIAPRLQTIAILKGPEFAREFAMNRLKGPLGTGVAGIVQDFDSVEGAEGALKNFYDNLDGPFTTIQRGNGLSQPPQVIPPKKETPPPPAQPTPPKPPIAIKPPEQDHSIKINCLIESASFLRSVIRSFMEQAFDLCEPETPFWYENCPYSRGEKQLFRYWETRIQAVNLKLLKCGFEANALSFDQFGSNGSRPLSGAGQNRDRLHVVETFIEEIVKPLQAELDAAGIEALGGTETYQQLYQRTDSNGKSYMDITPNLSTLDKGCAAN